MKHTHRSSARRTALLLALSLLLCLAACGTAPARDEAQGSDDPTVSSDPSPDTQTAAKFYQAWLDRQPVSDGASLGVLYSEVLDFEADGNPELLVLSIDEYAKSVPGSFLLSIYRQETHGMCCLMSPYVTLGAGSSLSLVESGGRLYLETYGCLRQEAQELVSYTENWSYCGSAAQKDGVGDFCDDAETPGESDWGTVDALRCYWSEHHVSCFTQPHGERGLTDGSAGLDEAAWADYQAVLDKYTTRAVLAYSPDGESITIKPEAVPERPRPPEPGPEESQPAQPEPVNPGPAESQQPEEPTALLATYAGNYTPYPTYDDYSGGRSITLNADGVVTGGETDGQTPTSIVQNSDGSITIWFGSSDRYTLFPVGCSGTPAGTGYDSAQVNLEYLYTGGGAMNIIYYADPASLG